MQPIDPNQPKITTHFPTVKKSQRLLNQKKAWEDDDLKRRCISSGTDPSDGRFKIVNFGSPKGKGVVAKKFLQCKNFICEYRGELINLKLNPGVVEVRETKITTKQIYRF